MLVETLKQTELSTEDWEMTRLIPNKCMFCGKPLTMSLANTGLSCSDEFCPSKVARRCVEFLKDVRFIGLGYSQMLEFCSTFELTCPVELFMLEESDLDAYYDGYAVHDNFVRLVNYLDNYKNMTLHQYLIYAKMPSIQDATAEGLTANFDDINKFLNTINIEGIGLIQELLNINEESSIRAIKIYEQLMLNHNVLKSVVDEGYIVIEKPRTDLEEIILVISDSAGLNWKKKSDFQDFVTEKFKDKFLIVFKGSVTKKTTILIAEDGTQTSKVSKAESYGIPVMNGDKFIILAQEYDNINDIINEF